MKREGLRTSAFAVNGDYVSTKYKRSSAFHSREERERARLRGEKIPPDVEIPSDFDFRNAEVRFRDRHSDLGERVDIRVQVWNKKDNEGDPVYSDWIIVHSPEITMWLGVTWLKGFVSVYKHDGKRVSEMLNMDDAPMQRAEFSLRPEAGLDEDGKWLADIKPTKKKP